METQTIILPGLENSGEGHWQTLWQREDEGSFRFDPASWDQPELDDWVQALDKSIAMATKPPLLVAHSLACLLVAYWGSRSAATIAGAFLAAIPDPHGPIFPAQAPTFRFVSRKRLPFPALVVSSSNDAYGSVDFARQCASDWGAGFADAGPIGHINASSGIGNWPFGAALLTSFRARLGNPQERLVR